MITPITDTTFLNESIKIYKDFLNSLKDGEGNKIICNFDGSIEDLHMLGYCEYEIGFPEEDYAHAAFIWANVIYTNSSLIWGQDKNKNIYLFSENDSFAINIKSYVFDFMFGHTSQFYNFGYLTEKLYLEMSIAEFSFEELEKLLYVVKNISNHLDSYSKELIYAIKDTYKKQTSELNKFISILKENIEGYE